MRGEAQMHVPLPDTLPETSLLHPLTPAAGSRLSHMRCGDSVSCQLQKALVWDKLHEKRDEDLVGGRLSNSPHDRRGVDHSV